MSSATVIALSNTVRGKAAVLEATPARGPEAVMQHMARRQARCLNHWDLTDPLFRARLVCRLERVRSPRMAWLLLALLDARPGRAWEGSGRLLGLRCLLGSREEVLRFAAYRWLATLHRIDLRCEVAAQRLLAQAATRESGLARYRVEQLRRVA